MPTEDDLTKRRFTDSAKRVVRHIAERSSDRGMHSGELTEATAEMLAILSMLRWEPKVGRVAMERILSDYDAFARELDEAIDEEGDQSRQPTGPKLLTLPSGQQAMVVDRTTPLMRLLAEAEHEAMALGNNYVGTEQLLLAAVRLACPRLQELLARHGVSYDMVKQSIAHVLNAPIG